MQRVSRLISYVLIFFIIVTIGFLIFIQVGNIKVFTLVSTSMEPTLKEGSLLFHTKESFDSIEKGDIITYKIQNTDIYVTHRVKEINIQEQTLLCKGDANKDMDETAITYEQYKGTLQFYVPYLGSVVMFMHGNIGKLIGIVLVIGLIASIGYDIYKKHSLI